MKANRTRERLTVFLGILTGGFLLIVTATVFHMSDTQRSLRETTYDQSGIAGIQLRLHFEKLIAELAQFETAALDTAAEEAVIQYNTLYERLQSFSTRPPYDLFLDAEVLALVEKLFISIKAEAAAIDRAAEGEVSALAGMRKRLLLLRSGINSVSSRSTQLASEFRARSRAKTILIADWQAVFTIALIVSGLIFVAVIWHQLRYAAAQNHKLKMHEQELRSSQELFSKAFQASPSMFVITDPETNVVLEINDSVVGILGYNREFMIGRTVEELKVWADTDERIRYRNQLQAEGSIRNFEAEFVTKDGDIRAFAINSELFQVEGKSRLLFAADDITKRREDEQRLHDAIESIPEGFVLYDKNDCMVICNNKYKEIYAASAEAMVPGATFEEIIRYGVEHNQYAEAIGRDEAFIKERLAKHLNTTEIVEQPLADGRWLRIEERKTRDGGIVGIRTDITKLKNTETELIQHRDLLEEKVKERTKELDHARKQAENANEAKSSFLANMSHEIRTPMNGVVGMVDILMQMGMAPEQQRMINTIRQSSFALLRIIDDILDTSKIEAGELKLENIPVHLPPVIEAAIETLIPTADNKKVRLSIFIDPELPNWIVSDGVRLRQILLNLLSNAVKFSSNKAGDTLGHVDLCAELTSEGELQFTVTDNGIGMTEDVRARLFKPFSQGEESTTRQFGGTGLGLVITRNLVEMMGGTISVDSTPGEGSTFTVTLPIDEAEGQVKPADLSGLKLFGLIDNRMRGDRAASYLEFAGSTVRFADNEKQLAGWVASEDGPIIVLLAQQTSEENDLIKNALSDESGRVCFLKFTSQRSDKLGLIEPNCYVIQRLPVLPLDLLRGASILAGRECPKRDLTPVEQGTPANDVRIVKAEGAKHLILLAEDNETNQEVIMYQLDMLGYAAEIADDGQQGLEMWKTGRFDLVLSDCHMPVMDGFEMTASIRKIERQNGYSRVPIIAITANALKGESDTCLAAGMDGYLSKPVELNRLRHMLQRWLPKEREYRNLRTS